MKKYNGPIAMYLVNVALIWGANSLYPENYVLGSYTMSYWGSILSSALVWTILICFTEPVLKKLKVNLGKGIGMMVTYLAANFASLWLIGRLGPAIGLGFTSYIWVLGLAVVANVAQYVTWGILTKLKLAKM